MMQPQIIPTPRANGQPNNRTENFVLEDENLTTPSVEPLPFSFSKKPILTERSSQSSQISAINKYPPQQCDQVDHDPDHRKFYTHFRGILKDKQEPPGEVLQNPSFAVDSYYSEKIRAPRMSLASLLSSNVGQKSRQPSRTSTHTSRSKHSSTNTLDSLEEEATTTSTTTSATTSTTGAKKNDYKPASYDLSKALDSNNKIPFKSILRDNTNGGVRRAGSTTSSNISPTRNYKGRGELKKAHSQPLIKTVRQIKDPHKLDDYIPPVLRPFDQSTYPKQLTSSPSSNGSADETTKGSTSINKTTRRSTPSSSPSDSFTAPSNLTKLVRVSSGIDPLFASELEISNGKHTTPVSPRSSTYLQNSSPISSSNTLEAVISNSSLLTPTASIISASKILSKGSGKSNFEPTHAHWRPNNSTSQCSNCKQRFSLIRRKHHCRHCGLVFCFDCVSHKANLNLLAKFEKPMNYSTYLEQMQKHIHQQQGIDSMISISAIKSNNSSMFRSSDSSNSLNSSLKSKSTSKSSAGNMASSAYSDYCKVCDDCNSQWLQFLGTGVDYEVEHSDLNQLVHVLNSPDKQNDDDDDDDDDFSDEDKRRESWGTWNWSTF